MVLSKVDYSPIRSGLRKRKRAESPVHAEPRVEEQWIDEDHLELWEIKAYRDKIERERTDYHHNHIQNDTLSGF